MQQKRIVAVHLLNDFSGSPLILKQSLAILASHYEAHIFTSTPSGSGFLSGNPALHYHPIFYRWSTNKFLTLLYFSFAQLILFCRLLIFLKREDILYINTLLPAGAAIAGKLKGCQVTWHIHEVSLKPILLRKLLTNIALKTGDRFICVSSFVAKHFNFPPGKTAIIYNALGTDFTANADCLLPFIDRDKIPFTVLMACSLKKYKGVFEFVEIARLLPEIEFILVLNADPEKVLSFKKQVRVPSNCNVLSVQKEMVPFYSQAHLILNLSLPPLWIETFGMTILEGMYMGLPAIVPPIGGICELVTEGVEGYRIDAGNINNIKNAIHHLHTHRNVYQKLSDAAIAKAAEFSQEMFKHKIKNLFLANPVKQELHHGIFFH
ncbi:glycosyltransferase family 4 protein [Chitinophaga sancti]|uniref:glycosyltransferase family 4 protein n=1 Tax=Chitinophaga sancti TaxID=1004 RepID=UPI003F798B5A